MSEKIPLIEEDLNRIFLDVKGEDGYWINVSAKDATDLQFDTWIRHRIIAGPSVAWGLSERRDVCDMLWQDSRIAMRPKGDGIADDTEAIQSIIDSGGGAFPGGIFAIAPKSDTYVEHRMLDDF